MVKEKKSSQLAVIALAALVYAAAAAVLFAPVQKYLSLPELLLPLSSVAAAAGTFLLSRRWVPTLDASLLSGLLYGFGPYLLSFAGFHPLAAFGLALVPWLFCPAVLWHKYQATTVTGILIRTVLLAMPLAVLFLWFWLPARPFIGPYFLMPTGSPVSVRQCLALAGVMDTNAARVIIGFYSSALVLSLLGITVFLKAARVSVFVPVLAAVVLTFWDPLYGVNPAVWFSIPALFLAVTAGLGAGTLTLAGPSDRNWIIACLAAAVLLAAFTFDRDYLVPPLMFALTAACLALFLLLLKLPIRTVLLRKLLLWALVALNLYLAARPLLM